MIGPPETSWAPRGGLAKTPVLLTNGDHDDWVPLERVRKTAEVFTAMGAAVDCQVYPGRAHEICDDEVVRARAILARLSESKLE